MHLLTSVIRLIFVLQHNVTTTRQRSCREVMVSVVCVCLSVHSEGLGSLYRSLSPLCRTWALPVQSPGPGAHPYMGSQPWPQLFNLDLTVQGPNKGKAIPEMMKL